MGQRGACGHLKHACRLKGSKAGKKAACAERREEKANVHIRAEVRVGSL
jgi:hypothetical protein